MNHRLNVLPGQAAQRHSSHVRVLAIACLGLLFVTPASALDRKEALNVLQTSAYFPRNETLTPLPLGNPVNVEVVIKTVMNKDAQLGNELNSGFGCAQKLGLLNITANRTSLFGTRMGTLYVVDVTEEGHQTGWVVHENVYGYTSGYVLPIYRKNAMRVTGIRKSGTGTATVDFETGIEEILPAGRCVHPNIEETRHSVVGQHRATLELFDDGWRVESVKAKGKHRPWIPVEPERRD